MQSVSSEFTAKVKAPFRRVRYSVMVSFDKSLVPGAEFFTIGSSTIGGDDIIKGDGDVIQEWDKYGYKDFTDRILSIEINRETEPPTSPYTLATGTIVLANHDNMFTVDNTSSPLYGNIKSRRPVRISMGFSGGMVSKFIGLTDGMPAIDNKAKTATFQVIDFLSALFNRSLDQDVIYQNQRTDQVLSGLFQSCGLLTSQFSLDTGAVIIPFAYWPAGTKLVDAVKLVAEAELGNVHLDETGVIIFENRQNWNSNVVSWDLDDTQVLDSEASSDSTIINVAEVHSNARQVMANQEVWSNDPPQALQFSDGTDQILPSASKDIFVNFTDDDGDLPVTGIDNPVAIGSATTSFYQFNSLEDGTGTDLSASVSLSAISVFSTSAKLTFTNNGSKAASLVGLKIFGTPAKVSARIYERAENTDSVGDLDEQEEQPTEIDNDLIQDANTARTIATMLVNDRGTDDAPQDMIVKAIPQLQVGDQVNYSNGVVDTDYAVTRVNDIIDNSGYRQTLRVVKRTIQTYFRIGISTIGSTDTIGP